MKHEHHRFTCWIEAIDFLMVRFNWTRKESIHFVRDNEFTIGTDRAIWLTINKTTVAV